ncbi:hypothetical protein Scep_024292 [Stephania cephalantha]|uniref:Uncharacterized protein n=1 Tax=Stephania cephalantha TaxID=152367 RepID=A0AAP0F1Q5_9MAGN
MMFTSEPLEKRSVQQVLAYKIRPLRLSQNKSITNIVKFVSHKNYFVFDSHFKRRWRSSVAYKKSKKVVIVGIQGVCN